ncbi:MAG: histidinol-phosphatase [Erysipelotrichaceae bacterium]|nr:histidinol-phosphatase [Erysipelotrichaceae bacterium]
MRQNFNYHTHTFRCGHAEICPDRLYAETALEAGFKTLGFSDHAPYPDRRKPTDRMDYEQLDDYLSSVRAIKAEYEDRLNIRLGFEMEYFPEYQDYIEHVLLTRGEYLILGQHYIDPDADYDFGRDDCNSEQLLAYGRLVEEALHRVPFLYLAHPDYFCAGIRKFDETCIMISHQICRAAAESGTPLEVNIKNTMRPARQYEDGPHYIYPFRRFWEIAAQYPVRCVYGFDAHTPQTLKDGKELYRRTDEILNGLKLSFIKEPLL